MTVLRPYGVRLTIQLFYCMLSAFLFCILSKFSTPLKIISRKFIEECGKWTKLVINKNDHSFSLIQIYVFPNIFYASYKITSIKLRGGFVIRKQMASVFDYFFFRYVSALWIYLLNHLELCQTSLMEAGQWNDLVSQIKMLLPFT